MKHKNKTLFLQSKITGYKLYGHAPRSLPTRVFCQDLTGLFSCEYTFL